MELPQAVINIVMKMLRASMKERLRNIESFDMHRPGRLHRCPQGGTDLHRQQPSVLITMLDRFGQRDSWVYY